MVSDLIASDTNVIDFHATKYARLTGLGRDDLWQEGFFGLLKAQEKFDPLREPSSWSATLNYYVRGSMRRFITKELRYKSRCLPVGEFWEASLTEPPVDRAIMLSDLHNYLLSDLPDEQQEVVKLRLSNKNLEWHEVADRAGMSRNQATYIFNKALDTMGRKSRRMK